MSKKLSKSHLNALFFIAISAVSTCASAHIGIDSGDSHSSFIQGLIHPLSGTDHLAAMVAVGLWSALALRSVWQAPLAFVLMLSIGALAGFAGFQSPAIEPMIAASMLVIGLLVTMRQGMPMQVAVALVGVFAFFHGLAHGVELAEGQRQLALLGMVMTTVALHLTGVGLGHFLAHQRRGLSQLAGVGVAALGTYGLWQLV
jgi:urease accessory protein